MWILPITDINDLLLTNLVRRDSISSFKPFQSSSITFSAIIQRISRGSEVGILLELEGPTWRCCWADAIATLLCGQLVLISNAEEYERVEFDENLPRLWLL